MSASDPIEILVVSAQASVRLTIERGLKSLKMPVKTATNGKDAIKACKKMINSLLVIDTGLPDMHTETLLSEINKYWLLMRDIADFARPRTLVLAKANEKMDEGKLKKLGVIARLQKPVNLKSLVLFVNKIVAGKVKAVENKTINLGIMDPEARSRNYFKIILKSDDLKISTQKSQFDLAAAMTGDDSLDILIIELMGLENIPPLEYIKDFKEKYPKCTIIPCSVFIDDELHAGLEKLGVKHILSKPINPAQLRETVRTIIAGKYA